MKKTNVLRKVLLSGFTLLFLGTTLVTSTYAWITINSKAMVSNINFGAISGQGIQVSVDGVNFKTNISELEMKSAIAYGYNPTSYSWSDGKLTDGNGEVSEETLNKLLKSKLLLDPVTSKNGYEITNLVGTNVTTSSGKFISFSLYFKTTSDVLNDNLKYQIYLSGEDTVINGNAKASGTRITATTTNVTIDSNMRYYNNTIEGGKYTAGESIKVSTANALRFSISEVQTENKYVKTEDAKFLENKDYYIKEEDSYLVASVTVGDAIVGDYYEATTVENETADTSKIYEYVDSNDNGSYATNYNNNGSKAKTLDELSVTDTSTVLTDDNNKLYNAFYNPMFTYYNSRKNADQIKTMSYDEDFLKNIQRVSYDETTDTVTGLDGDSKYYFTTVESGKGIKKVNFRFWLEGWDADCFDGIFSSIKVNLLFQAYDPNKKQKVN